MRICWSPPFEARGQWDRNLVAVSPQVKGSCPAYGAACPPGRHTCEDNGDGSAGGRVPRVHRVGTRLARLNFSDGRLPPCCFKMSLGWGACRACVRWSTGANGCRSGAAPSQERKGEARAHATARSDHRRRRDRWSGRGHRPAPTGMARRSPGKGTGVHRDRRRHLPVAERAARTRHPRPGRHRTSTRCRRGHRRRAGPQGPLAFSYGQRGPVPTLRLPAGGPASGRAAAGAPGGSALPESEAGQRGVGRPRRGRPPGRRPSERRVPGRPRAPPTGCAARSPGPLARGPRPALRRLHRLARGDRASRPSHLPRAR